MKVAIVIPIFNRPEYVRECFAYLEKANLPKGAEILLVDDCSTDVTIPELINDFCCDKPNRTFCRTDKNSGIRGALLKGIEAKLYYGCDTFLVLDNDVVIKPHAITRMLELHKQTGLMVSGINCIQSTPEDKTKLRNPLISKHDGYHIKAAVAGQCLLFSKQQYVDYVKPALQIVGNWDHNASLRAKQIAVTVPSVAQHIGVNSSMGHNAAPPDRACDFTFLELPDVTLFGIDSHDIAGIKRAADICQRDIQFGAVNIITNDLFTKNGNTEQRRRDYSKFMIKELTKHFDTSHVLTIHADGYVLNWKAWCNEWLQYDYIGASWQYKDNMNVGNGGFSLRSKKLCDILARYDLGGGHYHPEDHHICRTYRPALESLGIKFAPEEVANRFSIEAYSVPPPHNAYSGQFGFHGPHVDLSSLPVDIRFKKDTDYSKNTRLPLRNNVHSHR